MKVESEVSSTVESEVSSTVESEVSSTVERWYDKLGGRKFTALIFGIIIPQYIVILLAFWSKIEMAFNFATFFCGATVGALITYCTANVVQKIKANNHKNE